MSGVGPCFDARRAVKCSEKRFFGFFLTFGRGRVMWWSCLESRSKSSVKPVPVRDLRGAIPNSHTQRKPGGTAIFKVA